MVVCAYFDKRLPLLPVVTVCEILKILARSVVIPVMPVSQETHAASTYDRIVPARFPHNDNACKESRSYSKDTEYSTNRHGRDDGLIGGMA
jgi:hypothetical protein